MLSGSGHRLPNAQLKGLISKLYDHVTSLKEAMRRVTEENGELRNRLSSMEHPADKPEIRQMGVSNFYFVGEKGPYCQPCYDGKGKLVMLSPAQDWNGGTRRDCTLCGEYFYEKPRQAVSAVRPKSFWST